MTNNVCDEWPCRDMGKCLRAEHVEKRAIRRLERGAIEAFVRRQAAIGADGDFSDFGGSCGFDHNTALELIDILSCRVRELEAAKVSESETAPL